MHEDVHIQPNNLNLPRRSYFSVDKPNKPSVPINSFTVLFEQQMSNVTDQNTITSHIIQLVIFKTLLHKCHVVQFNLNLDQVAGN